MIFYYNPTGVGDVLLVYMKDGAKPSFESKGAVTRIFDEETHETLGYNFFNAASLLDHKKNGKIQPDAALIKLLNQQLTEAEWKPLLPDEIRPLIVTGYVREMKGHPDSDHMHVCQVDVGEETLQIVCGAPNIDKGQKVVVARLGALMPDGLIIRPTVLRGVSSYGMICSARELGLPNAPQKRGILVLDPLTEVGQDFYAMTV
ncbi:DUF4479 and tRNA-binding domain-containing protein [Sporolactobacillus sp. CPB3-1]|uniref:DUF4479 and tRNA-binding domain-containing protein n=1 Tax=Sporolactobacillus mangiferae TaxID=2940498 RepID=A0ABT0M729_9BACL|nr:DUF4479 and tRNA-binding domain-containing protein [Sporolactobacillus mangiferae]MCL1630646.1 DUF4479 and tRNA-binding domain-containing protein [Sporolactobacillus mangiferae]